MECKECCGTGVVCIDNYRGEECPFCKGKVKIDWVENILGVDNHKMDFDDAFDEMLKNV
jgi:hypothetical protein